LPDLFQRLVVIPPNTPWIDSYNMVGPIIIVGGILFFLGSGLIPSILAYIGDKAAKEFRGSAMGLYSLMLSGGIAVGTVLAGISDDLGGVQAVFYSAAVIFVGLGVQIPPGPPWDGCPSQLLDRPHGWTICGM